MANPPGGTGVPEHQKGTRVYACDKCCVWIPCGSHIIEFDGRFAWRIFTRGLMRSCLEVFVAESTSSSLGHHHFLPRFIEVGDDFHGLFIADLGTDGHPNPLVHPVATMLARSGALLPALGEEMRGVAKWKQGVEVWIRDEDHAPSMSPITAVGPTLGDVLLAPKTDATIATFPTSDEDLGFIEQMHG